MILYFGMETSGILKPAITVLPASFKWNEWDLTNSILLTFFSQESQKEEFIQRKRKFK